MLQKRGMDRNIDWPTFSIYLALVMLGWTMIFVVMHETNEQGKLLLELNSPAGKQMIWAFISFAVMGAIMFTDWKFWQTFAYPIYGITLLLLVGVLLFGKNINNQTSWFSIGGFSLQPTELAKFGVSLALAAFLGSAGTDIKKFSTLPIILGLIGVPVALIMLQPDLGSSLVFTSFLIVLYREGVSANYYIFGFYSATLLIFGLITEDPFLILIILFSLCVIWLSSLLFKSEKLYIGIATMIGVTAWWLAYRQIIPSTYSLIGMATGFVVLSLIYAWKQGFRLTIIMAVALIYGSALVYGSNHAYNNLLNNRQRDLINMWLQPEKCDPYGAIYNLIQSKMAISSGGFSGKGLLQGNMTRLDYVPEQDTDFIITVIGEEQGFIGIVGIILLFMALLLRIFLIAERQRSDFSRVYAYCFAGILFVHIFINIAMTMGLAPIIGIPLPFISRGGSSLLGFTIMLGVLLKLDSKRYQI